MLGTNIHITYHFMIICDHLFSMEHSLHETLTIRNIQKVNKMQHENLKGIHRIFLVDAHSIVF